MSHKLTQHDLGMYNVNYQYIRTYMYMSPYFMKACPTMAKYLSSSNSIESSVVQLWDNKQKFCNSGKHLQTLYSGEYQCTLCSYIKYTYYVGRM